MTASLAELQSPEREALFRVWFVYQAMQQNPDQPQLLDLPEEVAAVLAEKGLVTWFGEGLATPTDEGLAAYEAWQARVDAIARVAMQLDSTLSENQAQADVGFLIALLDAWARSTEFVEVDLGTRYRFRPEPADVRGAFEEH